MSGPATPADPPRPLIAGRYRQIRRLGTGGMSVVVLAEDTVLKRTVALKLIAEHLASDRDFVTRFRHEALAAARLQHPNIVQVYDSGHDADSNRQFIVMEFVAGTPLSELLAGGRQLDPEQAVAIAVDACEALACAHHAGVIHRDVKPANLIVTEQGTTKLMDFGIAKAAEMTRVTQAGSVLGTVAYLSPEQALGSETGPQSDIYSLAVVVYEMLAGRPPFKYKSITELAMKQRDETPPPINAFNESVTPQLDHAVRVALGHDPNLRFASAHAFAQALRDGLHGREDEFVTIAMSDPEAATRVIASGGAAARPGRGRIDARQNPQTAAPQESPTVAPRGRAVKRFFAVTLLLLALGAAAAGGFLLGGPSTAPVIENNVQDQIDGLRGFIRDNS